MKRIYLLILLTFNGLLSVFGQADFSYTTSNGVVCAPQAITFTEGVPGSPSDYIWNFGDGTSASGPSVTHIYDFPGAYSVTLTAVYANSATTVTKVVTVNRRPIVNLTANRNQLCQPGSVNFTADADIAVTGYKWNFGDGSSVQTTTGNTISHNFNDFGNYEVSVDAVTSEGCIATSTIPITVQRIAISATANPSRGCIPNTVSFTTNTTFPPGDAFQSATWTFGDGSAPSNTTSTGTTHTYNITSPVTTASVLVTSSDGCTNTYYFDTLAYGTPPVNIIAHQLAPRDTFCGSETIEFYGKADNANSYQWDFGDGTTIDTRDTLINYRYRSIGWKTITVRPYFNGCLGTPATFQVFITGVVSAFTFSNTCDNKNIYSFDNQSVGNISSFEWVFSDQPGSPETSVFEPTHTFPASGSFTAKLTVNDNSSGCSDVLSRNIYTATPTLTSDKQDVCKDSSITFTTLNTYPPNVGYSYIFHLTGNIIEVGGSSTYSIIPRVFGTWNDFLVITDSIPGTCNDTLNLPYPIRVRGPVMDIDFPTNVCLDTAVNFINNSHPFFAGETITEWFWSFGDGQKDSTQNPPPHLYPVPGQHIVRLEATDINGCRQHIQEAVVIGGLPSITAFPAIDTLCLGETAILRAYTSDSLVWSPVPSNCLTPACDTISVSPLVNSMYIASAISHNGCRKNDTVYVNVYAPIDANPTADLATVCPGTPVQLYSNTTGIVTWEPPTFLNNAALHDPVSTPMENIQYNLIVRDSVGCFADTSLITIQVHPQPVVDAGPDQVMLFGDPFQLSPAYPVNVASYLWTPAEGLSCGNCATPTGNATNRETYTIEIADANGCTASDQVTIFVTCEKSNLLLPNAFTPNGDGLNDWFYPVAKGYKGIKSFAIYNRNGFRVFERQNFDPNIRELGWDGRIKGNADAPTQVFTWVVEGLCDSGETIVTKGTVTLIR